jgi:hypothetical protein
MRPAFPTSEYYDPLRLPLGRPHHFPGSPVIGRASLPAAPQATGPRRLSRVPRTTIRTFNAQYAGGFISARSWTKSAFHGLRRRLTGSAPSPPPAGGPLDDACSGFTHVADRAVAPAPLRTRPLGHARGLHYRGPRHLPGPDSHRQAALNLSLLRHVVLLSSWRRSSLGAPGESDSVRRDLLAASTDQIGSAQARTTPAAQPGRKWITGARGRARPLRSTEMVAAGGRSRERYR